MIILGLIFLFLAIVLTLVFVLPAIFTFALTVLFIYLIYRLVKYFFFEDKVS